jgi:hypothetical protein
MLFSSNKGLRGGPADEWRTSAAFYEDGPATIVSSLVKRTIISCTVKPAGVANSAARSVRRRLIAGSAMIAQRDFCA